MANLTTQTKYVNIVVRKLNLKISERDNLIREWCNANCDYYAYIYHDKDYNLEGDIINEHLHLVCTLKTAKRLSTTLLSFTSYLSLTSLGVEIDKVHSMEGSLQYLIHKNDKEKYQYSFECIKHNYPIEELRTIIESTNDNLTAQRLYDIVLNARSNYDIICAIGLYRYHNLRNVIRDIKEDFRKDNEDRRIILEKGKVY